MVTATAYHKTGFDVVNYPETEEVLRRRAKQVDSPVPIDVIQIYGLTEIRLHGLEKDIYGIDYIKLSADDGRVPAYYVVSGPYRMASADVAVFPVLEDPFLELGGIGTIYFAGGKIVRMSSCLSQFEVGIGLIDPMFTLTHPPRLFAKAVGCNKIGEDYDSVGNSHLIVASTIELFDLDTRGLEQMYNIVPTGGAEENVSFRVDGIGNPRPVRDITTVFMDVPNHIPLDSILTDVTSGYRYYDYRNSRVLKAIAKLWVLGFADSIIGVYKLPTRYASVEKSYGGSVSSITSKRIEEKVDFDDSRWQRYYSKEKDIMNYCPIYEVGVISVTTGSKFSVHGSVSSGAVYIGADPHHNGAPFAILSTKSVTQGVSPAIFDNMTYAELAMNSVKGASWESVPIAFTGASGALKDLLAAQQSVNFDRIATGYGNKMLSSGADANLFGAVANSGMNALLSALPSHSNNSMSQQSPSINPGSILPALINQGMLGSQDPGVSQIAYNDAMRAMRSAKERARYYSDSEYVAPTVVGIDYNNFQHFAGNGFLIYALVPSLWDIDRYKEITEYFGMVCDIALSPRVPIVVNSGENPDYYYVQTSGCKIKTDGNLSLEYRIPMAIRNAESALDIGARFWRE